MANHLHLQLHICAKPNANSGELASRGRWIAMYAESYLSEPFHSLEDAITIFPVECPVTGGIGTARIQSKGAIQQPFSQY